MLLGEGRGGGWGRKGSVGARNAARGWRGRSIAVTTGNYGTNERYRHVLRQRHGVFVCVCVCVGLPLGRGRGIVTGCRKFLATRIVWITTPSGFPRTTTTTTTTTRPTYLSVSFVVVFLLELPVRSVSLHLPPDVYWRDIIRTKWIEVIECSRIISD